MYLDGVRNAQRVLAAEAGYRGAIDGIAGGGSLAAADRLLVAPWRDVVLAENWPPERRVIAAAQIALDAAGFSPGPPDGHYGPQTDAAFLSWRGDALPGRVPPFGYQADMAARFGDPGGAQCTAGEVAPRWPMVLAWDTSTRLSVIRCHELVAPSLARALDRVAAWYTPAEIRGLGLHLWGGCYNFRRMRGGAALSTHAWGVAVDFDPARNRLEWGADRARLAQPDAAAFLDAFEAEGWHSLGRARNFDWMHLQAPAP